MCGIAGFMGNFPPDLLDKMGHAIAHRGPDDQDTIHIQTKRGDVGLAHRRLSIIDLSAGGHQPQVSNCAKCGTQEGRTNPQNVWVTYNGEIYNFKELRSQLAELGHTFHSESDTEVLLHLYIEYGIEMVEKLNGIFAFAIYDGRPEISPEPTLWIARDHFGTKPLYYSETGAGVLFASEIKAITAWDGLDRAIDCDAVAQSLSYLWIPTPRTTFEHVKKLPPATILKIQNGKITKSWKYYSPPFTNDKFSASAETLALDVTSNIKTAVQRQLIADVPVGFFLSGGLDSSALVAMSKALNKDAKFPCFTIDFTGDKFSSEGMVDDLPYAQLVADHLDVPLHTIQVGHEMAHDLEKMIYHLDEPQADVSALNVMYISRYAKDMGIKVLLGGTGGDDIYTGYRRHRALLMEKYWAWAPKPARHGLRFMSQHLPKQHPSSRRISKLFENADLSQHERLIGYFLWQKEKSVTALLSGDAQNRLTETVTAPLERTLNGNQKSLDPIDQMLSLEIAHFLADHNLNYTDKMGMAEGVEIRVPFLDVDLVKHALQIPNHMKQRGSEGKWVFKKAMEPYLPHNVIYRPKTGFGAPVRSWIKGPLRELLFDTIHAKSFVERGVFDSKKIQDLADANHNGSVDAAYTLLGVICNEIWMKKFNATIG